MIGILLITHNGLGESLVDCVRHVMGSMPTNVKALPVLADDDPHRKEAEARTLIAQLDTGGGVLVLSDLIGSTPSNIAERLHQPGHVEGLVGVNLPMLLRAVSNINKPLAEIREKALETGRGCILPLGSDRECCDVATRSTDN